MDPWTGEGLIHASRAMLEAWRARGLPVPDPIPDVPFRAGSRTYIMTKPMETPRTGS
jgi:hypothetical protein